MKILYKLLYIKWLFIKYKYSFFIQLVNYKGEEILELRKKLLKQNILLLKIKTTYLRYFFESKVNMLNYKSSIYILCSNDLNPVYSNLKDLNSYTGMILYGLLNNKTYTKFTYAYLDQYLKPLYKHSATNIQVNFLSNLKNYPIRNFIKILSLKK